MPEPFNPVIHGMLLTDAEPLYLTAKITGGRGFSSEISDTPTWPSGHKIAAKYLAPYLDRARPRRGDEPMNGDAQRIARSRCLVVGYDRTESARGAVVWAAGEVSRRRETGAGPLFLAGYMPHHRRCRAAESARSSGAP